ncbi:MAG: adenosylcobinamide amidohydrolase [Chloroflexota bacterium]
MQPDFPHITTEQDDDALIIRSDTPLHSLSSAVVGGGMGKVHAIVNRHVHKHYDCSDPIADLRDFAGERNITGDFVGMLTAVWMRKTRHITQHVNGLTVSVIITAGVGNAISAGISQPQTVQAGTINIIALVDGNLSSAALVNAVTTITEAKTAVLHARDIRTPDGLIATGTSTDAVVIAHTGKGDSLPYGGPVTEVGYLLACCARECLELALDAP